MNRFVSSAAVPPELERVASILAGKRVVFLTGAGISTLSGLPDYRGKNGTYVVNPNYTPITFQKFMSDSYQQRRYWARATSSWARFSSATPSACHVALAALKQDIVTQNVDNLHTKAGSPATELHGSLYKVECVDCRAITPRDIFHRRILEANDHKTFAGLAVADGDTAIPDEVIHSFKMPRCLSCGGLLKPAVVFFGENVRKDVAQEALAKVHKAEALVVMGTTLTVWSAYRLLLAAAALPHRKVSPTHATR